MLFPYWHSWRNRVTFRRQLPATLRSAARIVAVSAATAKDLERRFPTTGGRITMIHNGVDADFTPATATEIEAIRQRYEAPAGYLLFVGTLEPRKNLSRLLDSWDLVADELPGHPPLLVAGGKGWDSGGLRRRLRRTSGVRYLGRLARPEILELVQGALVFVYPSLYEGFGLPVAEAMACGTPVVTSDTSSLPEVVGNAGMLVNPRHTQDLATALKRVVGDSGLRKDLAERGLDRARRFSWDTAAEELERVFLEVIALRQ
jgi:glycosyltransferase involved in cell wall biosynthesis